MGSPRRREAVEDTEGIVMSWLDNFLYGPSYQLLKPSICTGLGAICKSHFVQRDLGSDIAAYQAVGDAQQQYYQVWPKTPRKMLYSDIQQPIDGWNWMLVGGKWKAWARIMTAEDL